MAWSGNYLRFGIGGNPGGNNSEVASSTAIYPDREVDDLQLLLMSRLSSSQGPDQDLVVEIDRQPNFTSEYMKFTLFML